MKLIDILQIYNPMLDPAKIKIHLATNNGYDNPLEVYFAGEFYEWQRWQSKKKFERELVVSLIAQEKDNSWLFAGIHVKTSEKEQRNPEWAKNPVWYYFLDEDTSYQEMNGRLSVTFKRPGRQSYLKAENWIDQIILEQIYSKKRTLGEFPGYKNVQISKKQLDIIINQSLLSWKAALKNIAGVYLISDKESGQLYVGSATGEEGLWQRWSNYSKTGHGGNVELKKLLHNNTDRVNHFSYSILEIADTYMSKDEILARENHWKRILNSKTFGLNGN